MLDKVRKLLATAESYARSGNIEAAQSYTDKANALMVQYSISEHALAGYRKAKTADIKVAKVEIPYSPYQGPKEQLLGSVCRHNDCRVVLSQRWGHDSKGKSIRWQEATIVGFEADIEFAQVLYTSLLLQAEQEFLTPAVQERLFAETSHPGHRIRWRNDFMGAFGGRVAGRMLQAKRDARSAAAAAAPGSDFLPVLASKSALVDQRLGEMYGKLRSKQSSFGGAGGSGRGMGRAAGDRADLGGARMGPGSKGAIGR